MCELKMAFVMAHTIMEIIIAWGLLRALALAKG